MKAMAAETGVMLPQTKECCQPPEVGRGEGDFTAEPGEGAPPCLHLVFRLLSAELWEGRFLLLQVSKFVVI